MVIHRVQVQSLYFGTFECESSSEIHIPYGLPGFENERSLIAVEIPEQHPLVYLQSGTNPDLCFLSLPAQVIQPGFQLELSAEERIALGFDQREALIPGRNLLVLALLFPCDSSLQVNLAAPLIVHIGKMTGVQCLIENAPAQPRMCLQDDGKWVPVC